MFHCLLLLFLAALLVATAASDENSCTSAQNPPVFSKSASVGDLIDCLANTTRFIIELHSKTEILVTSLPWQPIPHEGGDAHVERCILLLGMENVVTYTEGTLEGMYPRVGVSGLLPPSVRREYVPSPAS
ncbi:uncharacterized protein UTRI_00654 [Ustilago trichophora]|uniref:Secreted protein n=1 Tax=Ustilago trichophora TaxID=86804 RepID=A0A5C3DUR1_9BASI|nr:uncharacterized protein UTRI_00654 [Ustilago trichophora]